MAFLWSSKLDRILVSARHGRAYLLILTFLSRDYILNSIAYMHAASRRQLPVVYSEIERIKLVPHWIWKESSIIENYFLSGTPEVSRQTIKISPFWLGVSSIYLAGSFILSPLSATFAAVLRVPVGFFLLYAVNPLGAGLRELLSKKQMIATLKAARLIVERQLIPNISMCMSWLMARTVQAVNIAKRLPESPVLTTQITGAFGLLFGGVSNTNPETYES